MRTLRGCRLLILPFLLSPSGVSLAQSVPPPTAVQLTAAPNCAGGGSGTDLYALTWTNGAAYDSIEIRDNGEGIDVLPGGTTSYCWGSIGVVAGAPKLGVIGVQGGVASAEALSNEVSTCSAAYTTQVATPAPGHDFPNDPLFDSQWHSHNFGQVSPVKDIDLDLPRAWSIIAGCENVVVALIDGGVDWNHPDLNMQLLPGYNFQDAPNGHDLGGLDPYSQAPLPRGIRASAPPATRTSARRGPRRRLHTAPTPAGSSRQLGTTASGLPESLEARG